jgi:hypothetical protein
MHNIIIINVKKYNAKSPYLFQEFVWHFLPFDFLEELLAKLLKAAEGPLRRQLCPVHLKHGETKVGDKTKVVFKQFHGNYR